MGNPARWRVAFAGWIAGSVLGFGAASFGWANPYIAASLFLGGVCLTATVAVASGGGDSQ